MSGYQLKFTDKILDNVHGFIEFTEVEKEIIELPVFKRLLGQPPSCGASGKYL